VDMEQALMHSCDVFFYTLGKELGIDRLAEYSEAAGLGSPTGIDLPHEEEGLVPSSKWKVRLYRDRWWPGETISVAIGQGALTVTPIQAAYAMGGLAMGGVWHKPHLLPYDEMGELRPGFEPPAPKRSHVDPSDLDMILRGMWDVVNAGGTGARAMIPGVQVCGKTGSAQRVSRAYAQNSDDPRLLDDAWFVGFAPCEQPEIVVAALYENGEHGSLAAPIVRDVIKAYFDKKLRLDWTRRQQEGERPRPEPQRGPDKPSLAAVEEAAR
ncbi:MAG: penicillin-binding protein 2, partial [Acidobacteria bacterium]|nr:penicillin-binding protein 2 [Acidobacteriota bacterium]